MLIIFEDVVRFEAKSVTSKRLIMRRIAFYPVGGERVSLPERHIKAYVDDYCHEFGDRKSTRLNSSHYQQSRMPYH